ncbi:TonB-dependent receptor [Pseudocolwellia agarivorans]|uniref:TonB-dependent receptor n=1 Tax=Pseudocolwellia agarivorans TaxID=1911682 RepID=UPI0009846F6B|nr:TonB-dependent receptor [Pseudocolwellia agarivorans]
MHHMFKKTTLCAAILTSLAVNAVHAEEENNKNKKQAEQEVEVIEVTGFRGSLQKAINAKRFSDGVTDSIHAEDVGKSTDQNIADALSRVTGVTVQEADGEGTKISVRGAGASLNQISLNGVTLTSGLSNPSGGSNAVAEQSVDLSAFSSDILSSIDVVKTASAEHNEGSLGANVILKTVQPLELKNAKRSFEYQGRYNDYSGNFDRKIAGTFSDKFFDDTVGVIITVSDETQKSRQDRYRNSYDSKAQSIRDGGSRDLKTNKIIRTYTPADMDNFDEASFDPSASIAGFDPDQHVYQITPTEGEYQAFSLASSAYDLNLNERKRQSITGGFQFYLGDDTELQLDLSHSNQDVKEDTHRYDMQFDINWVPEDYAPVHNFWTVDRENNTLAKRLVPQSKGRIYRDVGGYEVDNNVASLRLEHNITDTFNVSLVAGYSNTKQETKPDNASMLLEPGAISIDDLPYPEYDGNGNIIPSANNNQYVIQPTGYDCTSGTCYLVTGNDFVRYSSPDERVTTSPTNPLDPNLFRVARITKYEATNNDTNKSIFLDFDWDVDFLGINQVEFGAKYSNRKKDVYSFRSDTSSNNVEGVGDGESAPVTFDDLNSLTLGDVLENGSFPVNDFMKGLLPSAGQQDFLKGWGLVSTEKAFALASDKEVRLKNSPAGSREIEQDTSALYAQLNFNYMDNRITGNIGLRYVETKTSAEAYNRVRFQSNSNVFDVYDLVFNKQIANTDLPECDIVNRIASNGKPNFDQFPESGYPGSNGAPLCHDPRWIFVADKPSNPKTLDVDYSGNIPVVLTNDPHSKGKKRVLKEWNDLTTNNNTIWDINGNPINGGEPRGNIASDRSFIGTDSAKNHMLLPSLNINFALNDDMILRFGTSKTMARPRFDSTTPKLEIIEGNGPQGRGSAGAVDLKPLESNNLDLSFEWYFSESGLASIALFNKDMKNFEETVTETYLWRDIRENYSLEGIANLNEILIVPERTGELGIYDLEQTVQTPAIGGLTDASGNGVDTSGDFACMPDRMAQWETRRELTLGCHQIALRQIRNGKGANIRGAEISYTQNYDFLPGVFSGLGASVNYTFSDSESEQEVLITGGIAKPLPQANTPKHSGNMTLFWENDDIMMRLAARYTGEQLISRSINNGAEWKDKATRLDFSSSYKVNKNISVTFQALNLTDEVIRTFWTSTESILNGEVIDEGNVLDGSNATTSRTLQEYKTGRQFRLGVRANF